MNLNSDLPYVIVRSQTAGVHSGYLVGMEGENVCLSNSRRLWCWVVAKMTGSLASLSEVAVYGINSTDARSRIAVTVPMVKILGVCEILYTSKEAQASIEQAPQ